MRVLVCWMLGSIFLVFRWQEFVCDCRVGDQRQAEQASSRLLWRHGKLCPDTYVQYCVAYVSVAASPTKNLSRYFNQCCGSGMFIPDPIFLHPGFEFFPSRIRIFPVPDTASPTKNVSRYFNPKISLSSRNFGNMIRVVHPGSGS